MEPMWTEWMLEHRKDIRSVGVKVEQVVSTMVWQLVAVMDYRKVVSSVARKVLWMGSRKVAPKGFSMEQRTVEAMVAGLET
jgi:hypothetical protein